MQRRKYHYKGTAVFQEKAFLPLTYIEACPNSIFHEDRTNSDVMSNRRKNDMKTTLIYVEAELIDMTERRLNHINFSKHIKPKQKDLINQWGGVGSNLIKDVLLKQQHQKYKSPDELLLHRLELWIDQSRVKDKSHNADKSGVNDKLTALPPTPKVRKSQSFKDSKKMNFRTLRNKTFSLASKMGKSLSTNDLSNQNNAVETDITINETRPASFASLPNKGVVPRIVRRCFPMRHSSYNKDKNKQHENEEKKGGSMKEPSKVKLRPSLSNIDFIPTTYESEGEVTTRKRRLSKQRPSLTRTDNLYDLRDLNDINKRKNSKTSLHSETDSLKPSTRKLSSNQKEETRKYSSEKTVTSKEDHSNDLLDNNNNTITSNEISLFADIESSLNSNARWLLSNPTKKSLNTYEKSVVDNGLLGRQFSSAVSLRPCDINKMHKVFGTAEYTFIDIV